MQHRIHSNTVSLPAAIVFLTFFLLGSLPVFAQRGASAGGGGATTGGAIRPINRGSGGVGAVQTVEKVNPPDVQIDNKPAKSLSDDELIDFLQKKVQQIDQGEGEVRILRVAPGYPLTLFFDETYQDVILGDPGMLEVSKTGRGMVLSPKTRLGDTSMQVVFTGQRLLVYHVFIEPNFATGMTSIKVNFSSGGGNVQKVSLVGHDGNLNLRYIAAVISNYDALLQERAIDTQSIRRYPIFRKSKITPFTYYDIFRFADGTVAITFSIENRSDQAVRINEAHLRVVLGNLEFIPDYTSINHLQLEPGEKTPGFIVLAKTPFGMDQPFELNWR
jgi:hypothetical protein